MSIFPIQDSFTRGEISPRLHARASLELYKSALSVCEGFQTLPHGGIRKAGGTYFVGEVKDSSKAVKMFDFIPTKDQAYCLEVGDLYLRVYAYGARVGSVEVVTPWPEAVIDELQFIQSADVMWIVHSDYAPQMLTRTAHTTWSLEEFIFNDGPYGPINTTSTTMTLASYGSFVPKMTSNTAPSGTASTNEGDTDAWEAFDKSSISSLEWTPSSGWLQYRLAGAARKVCNAYWVQAPADTFADAPRSWEVQGSNDGSTWVTLDTRDNEASFGNTERRFYEFSNYVSFEYIRWDFTGGGGPDNSISKIVSFEANEAGDGQTPFNLTASAITGINDNTGFQTTDVGRSIRLLGSDGQWRWARIVTRTSTTVVTIRLYGHAMPDLQSITNWKMSVFEPNEQVDSVALYEERLAFGKRFSVYASKTGEFENFASGEKDADGLAFTNAGGGQANDILWLADADGFLLLATASGIRSLSGSGYDEALTPSSFKNRKSRTFGCAKLAPVDAGSSFLYVTRSRKVIAELVQNQSGRFTSDDIGQISEHIPKRGVVELAFQTDPDPVLWFPLETGELGGYTHQPSQDVRGMYRRILGGSFTGAANAIVERVAVTPSQEGTDDVWLIVKRTIGGVTKRYIEIMTPPFEYGAINDAFQVDCGLTYSGVAVTSVTGAAHLAGQTVDVLAGGKVYKGLVVSGGGVVTLPVGSVAATPWQVGLPISAKAATLELDVGGRDGSILGRRKRIVEVILSVFETDLTGLEISSLIRTKWEKVKIPTIAVASDMASLFTGNIRVPIDDSWDGQARIQIRHTNPTPCTIRGLTPVFDVEP